MTMSARVSVSLDSNDREVLDAFAEVDSAEHAALVAWAAEAGITLRSASEAAIARALLRAGAQAVRERALDVGYQRLAVELAEGRTERRELRDSRLVRADVE